MPLHGFHTSYGHLLDLARHFHLNLPLHARNTVTVTLTRKSIEIQYRELRQFEQLQRNMPRTALRSSTLPFSNASAPVQTLSQPPPTEALYLSVLPSHAFSRPFHRPFHFHRMRQVAQSPRQQPRVTDMQLPACTVRMSLVLPEGSTVCIDLSAVVCFSNAHRDGR